MARNRRAFAAQLAALVVLVVLVVMATRWQPGGAQVALKQRSKQPSSSAPSSTQAPWSVARRAPATKVAR